MQLTTSNARQRRRRASRKSSTRRSALSLRWRRKLRQAGKQNVVSFEGLFINKMNLEILEGAFYTEGFGVIKDLI